jgi:predicted AlkP superfamily phosphohydrolase/phosphomutase/tetratricopeptide (TPR) repeat protein
MKRKRLLLVGWDSADWKIMHPMIDAGHLPGVSQLVDAGTSGNLATLEPQLSPMLWTSIATGKMAYHHGVPGFTEVDPQTGAIVPVSAATRQCRTLWEILGERGLRSNVVSWFATQGERDLAGHMVSNMFCHVKADDPDQDPSEWPPPLPGTFWPPELESAMRDLRVGPHDIDPAHLLRLLIPEAGEVDQSKDRRLWVLAKHLAESFSTHNAAVHLLETDHEWDFFAVYYRAIDEISHHFMPYHPPQMAGVPQEDFERYRGVVEGAYRLHDLMLLRLLSLVGPDTAVVLVSDHGFHSDHLRPKFTPRVPAGITVWHRPQGVLIASGPGFKKDQLLYGAGLLDVAPTVLHHFGLPVGKDMEGRVLQEIFEETRQVEFNPTWERPENVVVPRAALGEDANKALLQQFVDLGYIEEIPEDSSQAAEATQCENDWNMARAAVHGGRFEMALPLLEQCFHAAPFRSDFAQLLTRCQMNLGLMDHAQATIDQMIQSLGETPRLDLLRASIAIQKENHAAALELLGPLAESEGEDLQLQLMLARSYLALRRWDEAEQAACRVLASDAQNSQASCIIARIRLHQNQPEAAIEAALDAIGLQYGNPIAHFLLGAALAQSGQWELARQALTNCLNLNPAMFRARRLLARVHRALGEMGEAADIELELRLTRHVHKEGNRRKLEEITFSAAQRKTARDEVDRVRREQNQILRAEHDAIEALDLIIVSGLPRSGTSLMMQILNAGGVPIMSDGQRQPDEDNPLGYWEWEDIKKLPKNPHILEHAKGRAIKVVSALLPALPRKHRYKVLYMVRPVAEIVDSQWAMLAHKGIAPRSEKQHLMQMQEQHSRKLRETLRKSEQVDLLEIDYPRLVSQPESVLAEVANFLGQAFSLTPDVISCVQPTLYRQRTTSPPDF